MNTESELNRQATLRNLDFTKPQPFADGWRSCEKYIRDNFFTKQQVEEACRKLEAEGWILSRERMPGFDGEYLIYGFMHHECGNITPFQKVVTCRFNQWVKSDIGEQMTFWRPLLMPPVIKSIEDHP